MIFFTVPSTTKLNKNTRIIVNSFGADNVPSILEPDESIDKLPIPIREDGAKFEGWYCSLNFDEKYKIGDSNNYYYYIINAKYDKCYCFSLRYGVLGCFGHDNNGNIEYYLPAGSYEIKFTDFSKADKGNIKVYNKDNNLIKQEDFKKVGEVHLLTIKEGEYVSLSENTVFEFQRSDVNPKFIEFRLEEKEK